MGESILINNNNQINMKIKLITGATGSGKTYFAINEAKKKGKFLYLAPCRQLAYEVIQDYGTLADSLSTGEVKMKGESCGNMFAVYESGEDISGYDTLIIDEAHFLADEERGANLYHKIRIAKCLDIDVMLLTATPSVDFEYISKKLKVEIEELELPSVGKKPIKEIDEFEFIERTQAGIPSIYFCKYSSDCELAAIIDAKKGIKTGYITADTPPSLRLETQNKFRSGEITLVYCTNVLAQGLNFPASNILIEYNSYDSEELILQKLGRIGRPYHCKEEVATYCLSELPSNNLEKKPVQIKKRGKKFKLNWTTQEIVINCEFEGQTGNDPKNWKYAIPTLQKYQKFAKKGIAEKINNFLSFIEEEEKKLIKIIKNKIKGN